MSGDDPLVLIVEDEPDVRETYRLWLSDHYEIRLADSAPEALDRMDGSVDVVLLDRMLSGRSGGEVLDRIRERGYDAGVAMVTAVGLDSEVVDLPVDRYVVKPPGRETLVGTVASLLDRDDGRVAEYRSLLSKRAAFEDERTDVTLRESEAYAELVARLEATGSALHREY